MVHRLSTLLAALLVLAACAGAPGAAQPTAAPAAQPTAAQPTAAPAQAERTITDASGAQLRVPAAPQRVVTLTENDLDGALALGLTPVGSVNGRGQPGLPAYLGQRSAGIESVGSLAEPSLEKLAALKPDLILAGNMIPQIEALLPNLQKIAPVVKTYKAGDDWKTAFAGAAAALNRDAEAQTFLADYTSRAAAIKAKLPAGLPAEASVVRWMPEGPVVMAPASFSSLVLADLGLTRPAAHAELVGSHGAHSDPLSMERLGVIDSGWLFIGTLNAEGGAALETARKSPLFQQLNVVKQNHVAVVDGAVWTSVGGPLAALAVLGDVEAALGQSGAGAQAPAAQAFPVTLTHKYGSTTVAAAPQRVLALGYTDQDALLALGTRPVAVRYWFGSQQSSVWPWEREAFGGSTPQLLNMPFGELNIEAIAALKPDLIVGVSSGITDKEYATLSKIAPTLAQSAGYVDFGQPWQEQTRAIGQALGAAPRAEQLVAQTEARFAALKQQHPQFAGATAVIAAPAADGQFYFSGPQHERQRVLTSLGFALPEELAKIAGDAFYGTVSGERLDLFDTDVLIWTASPAERATIEANPIYQSLAAVKQGRVIWLDTSGEGELVGPALVYSSVLSLPIVFDELVPQLAAAVDGDAATTVAAATR